MKKIVVVILALILAGAWLSVLSAGVDPYSTEYEAWKKAQSYTPEQIVKPGQTSSSFSIMNTDKDICELLVPLDGTFTLAMAPNDDGYTSQLTLPFTFSLYGADYNYCWINNNGNITFDGGYSSYTPWGFPISGSPMVAPFFADVDTRGTGSVWYKIESNRMIVIWDHVGYYGYGIDKLNTFELIISDGTDPVIGLGNNVAFSYSDMAWTTGDASGGSGGLGGTPATVGINKGDGVEYAQIGRFDHQGIDYDGPYNNNDGVDWLDCQLFLFNTGGEAANVAPVFVTVPPSPVELVIGETWNFTVTVISPEVGQTTNAVVNTDFALGGVVTPGNTCTIAFSYTALATDLGPHLVTIIATDDGTPNLSASYEFEIIVQNPPSQFQYEVNAFDLAWYQSMGYEFPILYPPFNDPNDVNAEILLNGVSFTPPVYTPYIFGIAGNEPFVPGTYSVVLDPPYNAWQPESVTFFDIITNYATDFLGFNEDETPVELSAFTATLTAQNYVQLTWTSQTETNMLGYRVYRNESSEQANSILITPIMIAATNTSSQQTYGLTDTEVESGHVYYYWLECVDINSSSFHGPMSISVTGELPPVVPEISSMSNAYPNPFKVNSSTTIDVAVKAGETGTVTIYNLAGQAVRSFEVTEGTHNIVWNGKDSKGNVCGSGVYFYKLSTPSFNVSRKMVIIK